MHRFISWTPFSSRNMLSKFQIFSQPARLVGNRFSQLVGCRFEYGALGLVLVISP